MPTGRHTVQRKKVSSALKKYGKTRLENDPDKYAKEIGVSVSTLKRWVNSNP
jgi:hypothetical protein